MIILGIDPGSIRVGYGVIKKEAGKFTHLKSGLLKIEPAQNPLNSLEKDFMSLIEEFRPEIVGLEKLFFAKNKKTALKVAETRGVILNAAAKKEVKLVEIAPSQVKLSVAGNGRADKAAVAKMVNHFLGLKPEKRIDDITDALAIAIAVSGFRG